MKAKKKSVIICDICQSDMEFKERVVSKKHYRIRRFLCPGCGHQQTVYADGWNDIDMEPTRAANEVNKKFNQESKNREL